MITAALWAIVISYKCGISIYLYHFPITMPQWIHCVQTAVYWHEIILYSMCAGYTVYTYAMNKSLNNIDNKYILKYWQIVVQGLYIEIILEIAVKDEMKKQKY